MIAAYVLFSLLLCPAESQTLKKFIGAVYEHAVILPKDTVIPVSAQEALDLMNKNMDILETAVKAAAEQVTSLSFLQ